MDMLYVNITVEVSNERYFSSTAGKAKVHMEIPTEFLEVVASGELVTNLLQAALEDHRNALVASTLKKDEELNDIPKE